MLDKIKQLFTTKKSNPTPISPKKNKIIALEKLFATNPQHYVTVYANMLYEYALQAEKDHSPDVDHYMLQAVALYQKLSVLSPENKKNQAELLIKVADKFRFDNRQLAITYIIQAIELYHQLNGPNNDYIVALGIFDELFYPSSIATHEELWAIEKLYHYDPQTYLNKYAQSLYYYARLLDENASYHSDQSINYFKQLINLYESTSPLSIDQKQCYLDLLSDIATSLELKELRNKVSNNFFIYPYIKKTIQHYQSDTQKPTSYFSLLCTYSRYMEQTRNYPEAITYYQEIIIDIQQKLNDSESLISDNYYAFILSRYIACYKKITTHSKITKTLDSYYQEMLSIFQADDTRIYLYDYPNALNDYVSLLIKNKQLIKALSYNLQLIEYCIQHLLPDHKVLALTIYQQALENQAFILEKLKRTEEGINIFKQAATIYQDLLNEPENSYLHKTYLFILSKTVNYLKKAGRKEEARNYLPKPKGIPTFIMVVILCPIWFSTHVFQETFYQPIAYYLLGKAINATVTDSGQIEQKFRWARGVGHFTITNYYGVKITFQLANKMIHTEIDIYNKKVNPTVGQPIAIRYLVFNPKKAIPQANINWGFSIGLLFMNGGLIFLFFFSLRCIFDAYIYTLSRQTNNKT